MSQTETHAPEQASAPEQPRRPAWRAWLFIAVSMVFFIAMAPTLLSIVESANLLRSETDTKPQAATAPAQPGQLNCQPTYDGSGSLLVIQCTPGSPTPTTDRAVDVLADYNPVMGTTADGGLAYLWTALSNAGKVNCVAVLSDGSTIEGNDPGAVGSSRTISLILPPGKAVSSLTLQIASP